VSDLTNYNQDEVGSASKRSDKHCPKGKRECGEFYLDHNNPSCRIFVGYIKRFEVCPWPSRQQPVEPPAKDGMTNWRTPQGAFNAGRIQGLDDAVGAVEEWAKENWLDVSYDFAIKSIKTAIAAMKEKP
jgi:hypothetical protein